MKSNKRNAIVRNSFYTFSKEYPAGQLNGPRRSKRHRNKKRTALRALLLCVVVCAAVALGFFTVELGFRFSQKEIDPSDLAENLNDNQAAVLFTDGTVRALLQPTDVCRDKTSIKQSIRLLKRRDCNAVVIDFKTSDGHLLYASLEQPALLGKCSLFDNETVRRAVKQYHAAGIHVIARVFCFEDPLIAALDPTMAVTYRDTAVPWMDGTNDTGGKPWLNPFSSKARSYLKAIVKEIDALGADAVLLESLCFPAGEDLESAAFPGEEDGADRNRLLLRFITSLKKTLRPGRTLLLGLEMQDLREGSVERYDGSVAASDADGILVHTDGAVSAEEGKPRDYDAQIALFQSLLTKIDADDPLLLWIPEKEYTGKYDRALRRSGFRSIVRAQEAVVDEE